MKRPTLAPGWRICECGTPFQYERCTAKHCSTRCRVRAFRDRQQRREGESWLAWQTEAA